MKLLKSTLCIVTLGTMLPMLPKPMPIRTGQAARTAPAQTTPTATQPSAQQTSGNFKALMNQVRTMQPAKVINNQGVFTSTFEDMVQSSGLETASMQALLEAGRNLHLPLSGNNEQNIETIMYTSERIDGFLQKNAAAFKPIELAPLDKDLALEDIEEYLYYDEDNAVLKQDYLEQRVTELLKTTIPNQVISILQQELSQKMRSSWGNREVANIPTRLKELNEQIRNTVRRLEPKLGNIPKTAASPQKPIYAPAKPLNEKPLDKKRPMGTSNEFELYIQKLTTKNQNDILNALFEKGKSGYYVFKNKNTSSIKIIEDMQEHLQNEFPKILSDQIIDAITYGIRAGLNVKVSPDANQLRKFISDIITPSPSGYATNLVATKYRKEILACFNFKNNNITLIMDAGVYLRATIDAIKKDISSKYNNQISSDEMKNIIDRAIFVLINKEPGKMNAETTDHLEKLIEKFAS